MRACSAIVAAVVAAAGFGPCVRAEQPLGLVIVAPKELAPALGGFVEHKRAMLRTELVTLDDAMKGQAGVDDAEKLKHYLYTQWKEHAVRYVLLVGDADVMPVRFMVLDRVTPAAFDYAFYPSDLYYADVAKRDGSFEDWNGAKEGFHAGYFGEVRGEKNKSDPMNFDGIDYRPELAVGRWPVSTVEQTRAVADKTIAYDIAMDRGEIKPVCAAVVPAGWVDARGALGGAVDGLQRWTVNKRFYADATEKEERGQQPAGGAPPPMIHHGRAPTEAELVSLLNGGASLVLHAGHGSDNTWEGCFSTGSIGKLKEQGHPAVMMSAGCSTARLCVLPPYEPYVDIDGVEHKGTNAGEVFTAPPPPPTCYARGKYNLTGLGEMLVREPSRGAVVYIGCNTGSQPCGLTLETAFVEAISREKKDGRRKRVGDCWVSAVDAYWEREHLAKLTPTADWYPASIFFQGMKFMYYGDPTAEVPAVP